VRRCDLFQVIECLLNGDYVAVLGVYVVEVCVVGVGVAVAHGFAGTIGRKPYWRASTAVARTQPEVDAPVMRVSMPAAVRRLERPVPKKLDAKSLLRTGSVSPGAMRGSISAQRVPACKDRSAGTSSMKAAVSLSLSR